MNSELELTNELRELVKAAYDEGWEAGRLARDEIKKKNFKRFHEHETALDIRHEADWRESAARTKLVRLIGEIPE